MLFDILLLRWQLHIADFLAVNDAAQMIPLIWEGNKSSFVINQIILRNSLIWWKSFIDILSGSHKYFILFLLELFTSFEFDCVLTYRVRWKRVLHVLTEQSLDFPPVLKRVHHVEVADSAHHIRLLHVLDLATRLAQLFRDQFSHVFRGRWVHPLLIITAGAVTPAGFGLTRSLYSVTSESSIADEVHYFIF